MRVEGWDLLKATNAGPVFDLDCRQHVWFSESDSAWYDAVLQTSCTVQSAPSSTSSLDFCYQSRVCSVFSVVDEATSPVVPISRWDS
ncbi:hypothetical protein Rcae01_03290 [Novipirellula caenicola]|uniref:Uncharacterized protein n=1 Tax=Novipirellula caenicola TaxID=1536901 RepID=A0ABP9VVJ1_9BACT